MEAEADIRLLLECMKCQDDNPAALKQALVTMATICTNQATSQEYLRKCGGLQFIFKLSISSKDHGVKQATLYTLGCAIDKNIYSQKELCSQSVFCHLYEILVCGHSSGKLIQTAVFLLLCLVANNSLGQVLVNKSKCLHNMLDLFRSSLKCPGGSQSSWLEELDDRGSIELWSSITSALCVCVNNPQNEENQRLCTQVFPQAFRYLQDYHQTAVVRPVVSFIGLAVANNVHNQDRVLKCGGLEVLVSILYRTTNQVHMTGREDGVEGQLSVCSAIISAIDAVITDNAMNAQRCGELGVVGMLLRLLQCSVLGPTERLQVTVMLGHCTDASEANQSELVEQGGMAVLLQQLTDLEDEELSKATKYVLQFCIHADKNSRKEVHLKDLDSMMRSINDFAPLMSPTRQLSFRKDEIHQKLEKLQKALTCQEMAFDTASLSSEDTAPSLRMVKSKTRDPCGTGIPGKIQQRKRLAKLQLLQPDGCMSHVRSKTDSIQNEDAGKSDLESETDKLKAELEKEQALRKKLEAEAVEARKALEKRKQQEASVANKAAALAAEFEKQQKDEGQGDASLQKKQREEQSKREHERLLLLKQEKQREMTELENQLAGLETPRDSQRSQSETQALVSSRAKMTSEASRLSANTGTTGTAKEQSKAINTATATVGVQTPTGSDGLSSNSDRVEQTQKETDTRRRREVGGLQKESPLKQITVEKSSRHQGRKTQSVRMDRDGFLVPNSPIPKTKPRALRRPNMDDSVWKHLTSNRSTPKKHSANLFVVPPSPTPSIESILDQELLKIAAGGRTRGSLSVRHSAKRLNRRSIPQLPGLSSPSPRKIGDDSSRYGARKAWSVVSRKNKHSSFHVWEDDREGCQAPAKTDGPILNSRTYNIALETNSHTCPAHRALRDRERRYIAERRRTSPALRRNRLLRNLNRRSRDDKSGKKAKGTTDVYSFDSGTGSSTDECYVSPAEEAFSSDSCRNLIPPRFTNRTPRRPRVPYTKDEGHSLVTGVQNYGRSWGQILNSFKFHPNRTGTDLKEKYHRLVRSDQEEALSTTERKPRRSFSMVEERRLKRGVRNLGYNWKGILATYKFAKGRSASELRDKWKTMNSRRNRLDRNKTFT